MSAAPTQTKPLGPSAVAEKVGPLLKEDFDNLVEYLSNEVATTGELKELSDYPEFIRLVDKTALTIINAFPKGSDYYERQRNILWGDLYRFLKSSSYFTNDFTDYVDMTIKMFESGQLKLPAVTESSLKKGGYNRGYRR